MGRGLPVTVMLILLGLLFMPSLSNPNFISVVNSLNYYVTESPEIANQPIKSMVSQPQIENTQVDIAKSFKNSSGFYKINGTIENHDLEIFTHIQVIKYYKFSSVNNTTLICYKQNIVNCEYKAIDNPLSQKSFFVMMPPAPTKSNIH